MPHHHGLSGGSGVSSGSSTNRLRLLSTPARTVSSGGEQIPPQLLEFGMIWIVMVPLLACTFLCAALPVFGT